jgi:hypothetical protein
VTLEPERQVPFRVSREDAETAIRTWLQGRWWSPGDLGVAARIEDLQALELPCWVFSATTESSWAADSSRTPAGSKGDWVPMTGEHQGAYQNLYVVASGILEPGEIQGVLPFDLCQTAPESAVEEFSRVREPFAFGRKYARPQARDQLRELVREACRKLVPGRCRNLHLEVRVVQMTSEPVLVPVWIVAYRYRGGLYRILLNGQSPRIAGSAPVSWLKVTLMVLLALSLLAVAVWALSR